MSPYIGFVKAGVFGRKIIDKTAKNLTWSGEFPDILQHILE